MSLYPSLEDMEADKMIKVNKTHISIANFVWPHALCIVSKLFVE